MKPQTSWRMLAISAAVAVMLTACGSGGDDGNGAAGVNGASPATSKPAVSARFTRNGNTVTVEVVDADGNAVPLPAGATIPVTVNGTQTTANVTSDGKAEFDVPSSENGFEFEVIDPSTGAPFTGSVPGARFRKDTNGNVEVVLVDANGNQLPSGPNQAEINSLITNDVTVDLGSGSGRVNIDPNAPAGANRFTLTDPDTGNTFTGIVDTDSYTDSNGYLLLGCNDKSPVAPASDWATVWDGSTQVTGDLMPGKTYTFKFRMNFLDSKGTQKLTTGVSRDVQVRLQAGEGKIGGVDMVAVQGSNPQETGVPMKDGIGEVEFVPIKEGPNAQQGQGFAPGFILGVRDSLCIAAKNGWSLRKDYESKYNIGTTPTP